MRFVHALMVLLCLCSVADARARVVTKTYTEAICPDCGLPLSRHAVRRMQAVQAMRAIPMPNQFQGYADQGSVTPQYRTYKVRVR